MSSRMKAFKPLLQLGDSTMIRRCISNYLETGVNPVIIVTGNKAGLIEEHVSDLPVECVFNPEYESCDMFTSVKLGLETIAGKCGRVFISPADIPCIAPRTLILLEEAQGDIVIPSHKGKTGHPLMISSVLIPEILAYDGGSGLKGAIESLAGCGLCKIEVEDEGILLDADMPEDYERLKAEMNESI